jgi:hypothetical protein
MIGWRNACRSCQDHGMWQLDRSNSADLIDRLRPHARHPDWDTAEVGEGWRRLVEECHERLSAVLPDYELIAIKQKEGVLAYQAFPRRLRSAGEHWARQERHDLGAITDDIRLRSEAICEWCGAPARLRKWRTWVLTLCGTYDGRFPDPPQYQAWNRQVATERPDNSPAP